MFVGLAGLAVLAAVDRTLAPRLTVVGPVAAALAVFWSVLGAPALSRAVEPSDGPEGTST